MGCTVSKAAFSSIEGGGDELFAKEDCPTGFRPLGILSNTGGIRQEKAIVDLPYDAMTCLPRYILKPQKSSYYLVSQKKGYKDMKLVRVEFSNQIETSRNGSSKEKKGSTTLTAKKTITITSLSDENIMPCIIDLSFDKNMIEEYKLEMSKGWTVDRKPKNGQMLRLMQNNTIVTCLYEVGGTQVMSSSTGMMAMDAPIGLRVRQALSEAEQQLAIAITVATSKLDILPMCKLRVDDNDEDHDRKRI